jgi:hypothetical protein
MNDIYILKEYYVALDKLLEIVDNRMLNLEENEQGDNAEAQALKTLFEQLEDLRMEA